MSLEAFWSYTTDPYSDLVILWQLRKSRRPAMREQFGAHPKSVRKSNVRQEKTKKEYRAGLRHSWPPAQVRCLMAAVKYSIIITCHNQRGFIADAIESALRQTCSNCELIVVDDGSTDGSSEVVQRYSGRAQVVKLPKNTGASGARNAGSFLAKGDYLVFLDGDDVLKPWALSVYDSVIQKYRPSVVLATLTWFQGTVPVAGETEAPREIEVVNYDYLAQKDRGYRSSASALVIQRTAFEQVRGWAKEACPFEDQHLEAKLAFSCRAITVVHPQTVFYRLHSSNTIHDVEKIVRDAMGLCRRRCRQRNRGASVMISDEPQSLAGQRSGR